MSKLAYTVFLAIASAKELSIIFNLGSNFLVSIIYIGIFFYLLLKLISGSLEPWIWKEAFGIVGFASLGYLILLCIGFDEKILLRIDSAISLYAWIRSLIYLNNYKSYEEL